VIKRIRDSAYQPGGDLIKACDFVVGGIEMALVNGPGILHILGRHDQHGGSMQFAEFFKIAGSLRLSRIAKAIVVLPRGEGGSVGHVQGWFVCLLCSLSDRLTNHDPSEGHGGWGDGQGGNHTFAFLLSLLSLLLNSDFCLQLGGQLYVSPLVARIALRGLANASLLW